MTTILSIFGVFLLMGALFAAFMVYPVAVGGIILAIIVFMLFPIQISIVLGIIVGGIALAYIVSE